MSSEAFQQRANAINRASSLITKLSNLQSALKDFDRLRLAGAGMGTFEDDEYLDYHADMEGIRTLACGDAGEALRAELRDPTPINHLCELDMEVQESDMTEYELRAISSALDRALAKAQANLNKVLFED